MRSSIKTKPAMAVMLLAMNLLIASCGGGGGGGGAPAPNTGDINGGVAVAVLTVTGTGTSGGTATIDPNTNGGSFTLSFNTSGPGAGAIYIANAYINLNGNYNGGTVGAGDYRIGSGCGATSASDSCHASVTYTCTFNTSHVVSCVNQVPGAIPITISIQAIITAIPQSAYVVAYVCNALLTQCTSASVPVIFQ